MANAYDFTGRSDSTKLVQTFNSVTTTVDKYFTYDHQGRLTKTEQEITGDANGKVTVAENVYSETGQLVSKKLHKAYPYDYIQNVDYSYNIRGWLTSINNPDNLSSDLFGERLLYESSESGLNSSYALQYNGNIAGMVWNSTEKSKQGYGFTYDGLNRLTTGDYKYYSGGWNDHSKYEERSLTYDKNGNIGSLLRSDQYGNTADNFTYNYSGNQLSNISGGTSYVYDQNGNTTTDGLRGMAIGYNLLNLPSSISKSSESISYIYSAAGEKLAKRDKNNLYRYYAGSMVYDNNKSLSYILFEEGLVNKSSGAFTYEYHLKDHLGNTRVAFQPNGGGTTTTQVAEYYPFGSSYLPFSPAGSNKYLYNGKEKQDDVLGGTALDEYDYGARFYDARIGRWHVIDPLVEKMKNLSPYVYCMNNSMRFIDIDGLIPWPVLNTINGYSRGITSGMYRNTDKIDGSLNRHGGVDIAFKLVSNGKILTKNTDVGAEISATHSGKMTYHEQKNDATSGNYIEVENGDIKTRYLHLKADPSLKNGTKKDVKEGAKIGQMGQSGTDNTHLHYEIWEKDKDGNWLKQNPVVNDPSKVSSFTDNVELKDPQLMIDKH